MKNFLKILVLVTIVFFQFSCKSQIEITPKEGTIKVPAKGEITLWKDVPHNSFSVNLENTSAKNSCEIYKVNSLGIRKWIYPSLQANKSENITIKQNGSLLIQNYSDEILTTINYKIN